MSVTRWPALFVVVGVLGLALKLGSSSAAAAPDRGESGDAAWIVGGHRVKVQSPVFRSTVVLLQPNGWPFCTGTLITPRHVVTAGHCLASYHESSLVVGFGQPLAGQAGVYSQLRVASLMVVHQAYDLVALAQLHPHTPPSDIALVTLAEPAPPEYAPVPMLTAAESLVNGEELVLAGYGLTNAEATTAGILRQTTVNLVAADPLAHEIEFRGTTGQGSCLGDSGGPAFVRRHGELRLLGVTSRGVSGCIGSGVYTDIRFFQEWLTVAEGPVGW